MLILTFLCTEKMPKNGLFFHCGTKSKELSKKELSNVTPASVLTSITNEKKNYYLYFRVTWKKWPEP